MILTASVYGKVSVWSSDGALLTSFAAHRFNLVSAEFSPDGKQIVTTGYMDTENNASVVKLWSIDGKLIDTLEGPPSEYSFAEFAPNDNSILASFGTPYERRSVKFWQPGKISSEFIANQRYGVKTAAFSKDGQHIWMITHRRHIELWGRTGEKKDRYPFGSGDVHFSKGGEFLVALSRNTVTCFDLNLQRVAGGFKPEDLKIDSAIACPDSKHILTIGKDGAIAVWTRDGEMRSSFKPLGKKIRFIDFVGVGDRIFVATDGNLGSLWDLDGRLVNTFSAHSNSTLEIRTCSAFGILDMTSLSLL
jgi:WD40 repeat protein